MIEVITSGFRSSIQDLGRFGGRLYGIPVSGAMDQQALKRGNRILYNPDDFAGIEWMMQGPILKFLEPTVICLTGGVYQPKLNGKQVRLNSAIGIRTGDQLQLGALTKGVYGYLTIKHGIVSEQVMNSQSLFKGITKQEVIKKGDRIFYQPFKGKIEESEDLLSSIDFDHPIPVIKGPEFRQLTDFQRSLLFDSAHELSATISRMGYRFKANNQLGTAEIITAPVLPGSIQLTPAGELIALMRDAQTTGGYARVLQITLDGIDQLAQQRFGTRLRFRLES